MRFLLPTLTVLSSLLPLVTSLGATDSIQDADSAQSGYLSNHNMHPATVGSSIFGMLWKNQYGAKEKWYGKPLVYTPPGGTQIVFLASSMNIIRTLDAVTGALVKQRQLMPPFLQSDIGCTDIPDYIGVTGTPIIDPNTNTAYFFAKGYKGEAASGGVANGIYKFYAVDIKTLDDKPGFPVTVDGGFADNDNTRYFIGGTVLQRPALAFVNGYVVGGFGGHCDLFNYTGYLISMSTQPGVGVASLFAMESSPGAPRVSADIIKGSGGEAGIWQGGMSVAVDGNRFFVTTGNGQGHENLEVPASGRTPLSTLDEIVASFTVGSDGKLSLNDYFEPYEYLSMDAGDRDLGSSGVTLLDPTVFKGTGVARMALTIGKNGKAYILNANNLGGYKQGPGGTDNIVQTIIAEGAVFAGVGSYPLEGGYIYFTPVGFTTVAYKIGLDSQGLPTFTKAGNTATKGAGRVGIGSPTITTYKGQAGTGILWITDPDAGLRAFNAVPVNGVLTPINVAATGGLNKFQRPAFGDGRLYVTNAKGQVICLGSPVALPLNCTQPVDFGSVVIGSTVTRTVNCTALIDLTSIDGCSTGDGTWQCKNSTLPKGKVPKGTPFNFPVTWNLTQASINDARNASFGKVLPGVASTSLDIFTTNAIAKYSNILPISLTGTTVSSGAFLVISPPEVDLGGIVVGSDAATSGLSGALQISNVGSKPLTFLGSAWTDDLELDEGGTPDYTNITNGDLGSGFSSSSLPNVGDVIAPDGSLSVPLKFKSNELGQFATFIVWWTTGGYGYALLTASAATGQVANISVSTASGGWDDSEPIKMDFGLVQDGTRQSRYIRICNSGGSALTVTKSKPPITTELFADNSATDLHEGQSIDINDCALGQVSVVATPLGVNRPNHTLSDAWILNTDDVTFGVHDVAISATVYTRQVGPLLQDGNARYPYLGCYYDGAGRLLTKKQTQQITDNAQCQQLCFAAGYTFAGTEYHYECWCGNAPPPVAKFTTDLQKKCAFSCTGDTTQSCGGVNGYISVYYDRTKYTPGSDSLPQSSSSSSTTTASSTAQSSTISASSSSASLSSSSSSAPASSSASSTITSSLSSSVSTTQSISSSVSSSASDSSSSSQPSSSSSGASPSSSAVSSSSSSSSASSSQTSSSSTAASLTSSSSTTAAQSSSSSSSTTPSSSAPTTTSSSSAAPSSSSSPSTTAPSTTFITTTSSAASSSSSNPASSSASPTPRMIQNFQYYGCFSDVNTGPFAGHNMRLLSSNSSMTPQLCISSALARLSATPATIYSYIGLEYGKECYAATVAPTSQPTSLVGAKACTLPCAGDPTKFERCGGSRQQNLWVLSGVNPVGTTSGLWTTPIATATPTA